MEWEVLARPAAMHGGKALRSMVQRPGLPPTTRAMSWVAHERVTIRRQSEVSSLKATSRVCALCGCTFAIVIPHIGGDGPGFDVVNRAHARALCVIDCPPVFTHRATTEPGREGVAGRHLRGAAVRRGRRAHVLWVEPTKTRCAGRRSTSTRSSRGASPAVCPSSSPPNHARHAPQDRQRAVAAGAGGSGHRVGERRLGKPPSYSRGLPAGGNGSAEGSEA